MDTTMINTVKKHSLGLKIPQGPKGNPVLGSISDFQNDPLGFITRAAMDWGEVSRYRLGNMWFYQVNHPEGIQRVLQENNHNYIKGKTFEPMRMLSGGDGLVTSEGKFWLRQRRLMQPAFHRQRLAAFGDMMVLAAEQLAQSWAQASGRAIDVSVEMTRLTLAIATQALFGHRVEDENNTIGRLVGIILRDIPLRYQNPFYPPLSVPTLRNRQFLAARNSLDQIIYGIIHERRQHGPGAGDLLDMLMEEHDEETGEGMSDKQLRDELLTLFIAGHETTAITLTWVFYLLSAHPDVERRVRAELEAALGGRTPAASDLHSLPYSRMVIEEALRLYPPAWMTNRTAVDDDVLCGYRIPAGALIGISPYVIHHHPEFWENPEGFDPERFTPERSSGRARFAYLPFGGGPHQCIGQGFAMMEAQLVLATLMQRCRLHLAPGRPVVPHVTATIRPAGGLLMSIQPVEV